VNVVGEIKDSKVKRPADMLVLADSKPDGSFDGNIDPKQQDQWPSNRHDRKTVLNFADGHSLVARRHDIIDPNNRLWRVRWNNDNEPHNEISWSVNWTAEAKIDP